MTRHQLLTELHQRLQPQFYLEVGVQYGTSLNLAVHSKTAIGVDPEPQCRAHGNQQLYTMTSDDYFQYMFTGDRIDFAFIDGSHLFEDALRDFINIEMHSHEGTVVVFDDVLPLTQEMTSRIMVPGHWTGDVWKVSRILHSYRPDLHCLLVDTEPTGTMIVSNLQAKDPVLPMVYSQILDEYLAKEEVPVEILNRSTALPPKLALGALDMEIRTREEAKVYGTS